MLSAPFAGDADDTRSVRSFVSGISRNNSLQSRHRMQTQVTRQEELEERETLKRERFWNFFTMTTACTYGIALVMLGCSFYLADIFISYEGATTISAVWKQFQDASSASHL